MAAVDALNTRRFTVPQRLTRIVAGGTFDTAVGESIVVENPATEDILATLIEDDAGGVDEAVRAAREAFDRGPWPRMPLDARRAVMTRVRDTLLAHADELAYLECLDTGVPLWDIRGRKLARVAENFQFFMDVASTTAGETFQQDPRFLTFVTREPVGVAAILAPWNSPMSLASMQIAPCLAFGNTCIVKPSEHTPVSLFRMVQLMQQAGLPPGVVNLVNGRGPVTGAALVAHDGVDLVKFIGGTRTGASILTGAASGLKKVGLELGGKSANIIFEDADFDAALTGALLGIYSNNGQQCLAGSRILVQRSIAERFVHEFCARAKRIRIGDPLAPQTELGPLAFRAHYERVLAYVDVAVAQGARLLVGGKRAPGFEKGYYVQPTAVLASDNAERVCQEEIFGPFATFLIFDTQEQAIELANASPFGLVGYVWTRDVTRALAVSQKLRAGTVWVNSSVVRELRAPFGGFKQSGIGRDGMAASLDFFTEQKTTSVPLEKLKLRAIGTAQE